MQIFALRKVFYAAAAALAVLMLAPLLPRSAPAASGTASSVHLHLRLAVAATKFHQGELIPLELAYSSDRLTRYLLSTSLQSFCGNEPPVRFVVTPSAGTHDPERLYWAARGGECGGDILSGIGLLSRTAVTVPAVLNDFTTIDRTGVYRLYAVSHQVSDIGGGNLQPAPLALRSNEIQFEIVAADPSWQRAQLVRIREVLDHTPIAEGAAQGTPRADAAHALRFLTSEDSAREMARRLRGEESFNDFQYQLGLIDSPQRSAALSEMKKLFGNPNFPVSGRFLEALALISLDPNAPTRELFVLQSAKVRALREQLADNLSAKDGEALAASLDTVMQNSASLSPAEQAALVEQILPSFAALPLEMQTTWLQDRWPKVKGAEWEPVLQAIATRYEDFPDLRQMDAWQSLQLSGAALKDWYEIDPARAREAFMTEITRPKPRYDASVLGLLPDLTLPGADELLAENFLAADSSEVEANLASLLWRYGDAGVLPEVLPKIEEKAGTWACDPQDTILAFALKAVPDTAKPLIERALAARGPGSNACRHRVLTDVARLQPIPSLQEIAIPELDDSDPQVAINAAEYLGEYGSAAAEQALWEHYQSWSRQWSGHADQLRVLPGSDSPYAWESGRGAGLAHALATGIGWLADGKVLQQIADLDVTNSLKPQLENDEKAWEQRPMAIVAFSTRPVSFQLAQYNLRSCDELKAKLAEFPRGTEFTWAGDESPEGLTAFKEISAFASRHGLLVRIPAK